MLKKHQVLALVSLVGLLLQIAGSARLGISPTARKRIRMANQERFWEVVRNVLMGASLAVSGVYLALRTYESLTTSSKNAEISKRLEGIIAEREEAEKDEDGQSSKNRRDRQAPKSLSLNSYEQSIASEVVHPADIPVTFDDIGGLDDIISDLQESVIYPLTLPQLYRHSSPLLSAPSGVLLYGPPGCGKTMLAKALAHESGAVFINLHISTLTEKWYGDSNKLVAAVFSLARKLQPAIVFIDEIDAVLGTRRSGEHEASGMVKAEMMTHWDGLASANSGTRDPQRILVLGATNRIQDIDEAILRRMPKRFAVGLPDSDQRRRIFNLILRDTKLDNAKDSNGNERHFDLDFLVKMSAGMSGSDIKEVCREAAMIPMREFIQSSRKTGRSMKTLTSEDIRGLRTEDFFARVGSAASTSAIRSMEPGDAEEYITTDEESGDEEKFHPSHDRQKNSSAAKA